MKCKTTGATVSVQPSMSEKGYWLVTYFGFLRCQYIHTTTEMRKYYVF